MNKKALLNSLLVSLTTVACTSYATVEVNGNINFQNTQSSFSTPITVNGNVETTNSKIDNAIIINGSLTSKKSSFKDTLTANGGFDGYKTNFVNTTVNGSFNCEQCSFDKNLTISSDQIKFSDSQAKNVTINTQSKGIFSSAKTSSVYLNDKSIISGNITFNNGSGIVYLNSGSEVKGQIINGKSVVK